MSAFWSYSRHIFLAPRIKSIFARCFSVGPLNCQYSVRLASVYRGTRSKHHLRLEHLIFNQRYIPIRSAVCLVNWMHRGHRDVPFERDSTQPLVDLVFNVNRGAQSPSPCSPNQTRPRRIGIDGPTMASLCFCPNSSKTCGSGGPAGSDA